jgi:hypothetical protein
MTLIVMKGYELPLKPLEILYISIASLQSNKSKNYWKRE